MNDPSPCPFDTPWTSLVLGVHEVLAHRVGVTTLSARGVRTCDRFDWFWSCGGADRWVVFHRSEHLDPVGAEIALRDVARDVDWQEQLLGRRREELAAAPLAVADLQRAAIAALRDARGTRLRAALPEERAEIAGLAVPAHQRPPAPEDLPPLVSAAPADPAADRLVLSAVLPAHAARALHRHGVVTVLDLARLTATALRDLPGVDQDVRRHALAVLRRHGLLLAPDRCSVADLRERRDGRRRQAARFAELLRRGYGVEEIAAHARRSVGYVRLVLGDRVA